MNQNSKKLAATLFPIEGLLQSCFQFRVLTVRETIPEDNHRPIRMQKWADSLWQSILKCPVYPTRINGKSAFLIPIQDTPSDTIELRDVPDHIYHVDVSNDVVEVSIEDASAIEKELICKMLERPFSDRLRALKSTFWRVEWIQYFLQKPENVDSKNDILNAYRGYKFGVIVHDNLPHLAVDIRTRYIGRTSLAHCLDDEKKGDLLGHLNLKLPIENRATLVRDNGSVKISCRYAGETGNSIKECKIKGLEETVLQYYNRKYPELKLNPNDRAVFVQDRISKDPFGSSPEAIPVPESRLFPVFTTEYHGVKKCSVKSQLIPQERMNAIREFLDYFKEIQYGDTLIEVKKDPLVSERTVFVPPNLEFGNNTILNPFPEGIPDKISRRFDRDVSRFGSEKISTLYRAKPYHIEPLPEIVFLYPRTINRATRETFLKDLKREIMLQTGKELNIVLQRAYQIGKLERMGSALLEIATEVKLSHPRALVLVILWRSFYKSVHGELKETINPMRSQCASERTLQNICNQYNPRRARSQLRNLALAVLTEAGVKPWVLADPLHHDLYIGIDTLYGRICYHFLYGIGGRFITTQIGHSTTRGRSNEAIKKPELQKRLINEITQIIKADIPVKSIIIHRDGRWWPSENDGLKAALKQLIERKILPVDVRCGVVEIRKTHKPIRLFTQIENNNSISFQNPLPGTYLVLDQDNVVLTTTGRPGEWDVPDGRTARTILLKLVEQIRTFEIEAIAEDAYRLSHLNWSAPDIEINLPVTIRWTDEALRETFRPPIDEEEEIAEYEIAEDEMIEYEIDEEKVGYLEET